MRYALMVVLLLLSGAALAHATLSGADQSSNVNVNGVKNVKVYGAKCDGSTDDHVALQAAFTAGGTITAPPGVICMTIVALTPAANSSIIGNWTIKAMSGFPTGDILTVSATSVTLQGITVDGNSASNKSSTVFGIDLNGATSFLVDGVNVQNVYGTGINIHAGASGTVRNSASHDCGETTNPEVGGGINVGGPTGTVAITNSKFYNNAIGSSVFPSPAPGQVITNLSYDNDDFYSNGTDGWQVFSNHNIGGSIQHIHLSNSRSYCNGWISGGAFSTNCSASEWQNSSFTSPSVTGIGFNIDSPSVGSIEVVGNKSHDNVWDGFDNTPMLFGAVNTSGTAVTWVSGDTFNTAWQPNSYININTLYYQISAVNSSTSITLASSAGTQSGVQFIDAGPIAATYSGNVASHNGPCVGSANGCSTFFEGSGFSDISIGTTYTGNQADHNYLVGFNAVDSSLIAYEHNSATDNCRGHGAAGFPYNSGYGISDAFGANYVGNQVADDRGVPLQALALSIGGTYGLTSNDPFNAPSGAYSLNGTNTNYSLINKQAVTSTTARGTPSR